MAGGSHLGRRDMAEARELFRMVRERAMMSQADLSRHSGMSRSSISRFESGERGVSIDSITAMLDVLCNPDLVAPAPAMTREERSRVMVWSSGSGGSAGKHQMMPEDRLARLIGEARIVVGELTALVEEIGNRRLV